jgi:NAD(P)-dependent dehydrogenase (short-subunit alcohol dehydrogenase family)
MARTWFVTGSSRGRGHAFAKAVIESGDRLAAAARNPKDLENLVELGGERVVAVALDVTDASAAQRAVATAVDRFGRLDVVVNHAGYGNVAPVEDTRQLGQPPMRRSWNDPSETLVVVARPMQKPEKRSDVGDRRRAGGRRRRNRLLMLDGGKDLLRRQPPEVLGGVVMSEPDQKASSAQKDAIAGLRLEAPYLDQIS